MQKLLLTLMALLLVASPAALTGCTSTGDGSGVRVIEDMSDDQFDDLINYTETGVRLAISQILQRTDVDPDILQSLADALNDTANADAVTVVSGVLSDIGDRALPDSVDVPRSAIMAVLSFIESRVDLGGFVLPDGSIALSVRTKGLIGAVANGIEQGIAQQILGMVDPQVNNPRYADIMTVTQQNCNEYNASREKDTSYVPFGEMKSSHVDVARADHANRVGVPDYVNRVGYVN